MLRYKTKTRPGLVTLYDIQPGNGAGPFLQPQSPHVAATTDVRKLRLVKQTPKALVVTRTLTDRQPLRRPVVPVP